jgi:hypothetical protein
MFAKVLEGNCGDGGGAAAGGTRVTVLLPIEGREETLW